MNSEFFNYMEMSPHPFLQGIVAHYRVKQMKLPDTLVFPNYSPVFQGLIFNLEELEDVVLLKKDHKDLKHKVYYVGQAVSPSYLFSSSLHLNLIAVNFTPVGLYRLTGIDLHYFTDKIVDAQIIFGSEINEIYEQILAVKGVVKGVAIIDDFLCRKALKFKKESKTCILTSLAVLNNDAARTNIKKLQQITNTCPKTLERSFKTEIGMTPKTFQRLLRFNQAKLFMHKRQKTDWWEIAVRFGFYDHSHFISEFQTFAGLTPTEYLGKIHYGE